MSAEPAPEQVAEFLRLLSPALRALLERELARGNRITRIGGGFPAPPIGALATLAEDIPLPIDRADGLRIRERNSSLNHLEITDAEERYYLVTPPLPPPPEPDMDAIRARHQDARPEPPPPPRPVRIELDLRGETILYCEPGRRTSVVWTYTQGHRLYRSSLVEWFDESTRTWIPIDAAEREIILAAIVRLAETNHGLQRIRIED